MVNLMRANEELFKRPPDECFESLGDLRRHCYDLQQASSESWFKPQNVSALVESGRVAVRYEDGEVNSLNEWSFGQLCSLCKISPGTINRLSPDTATKAINETLPSADRPIQFLNGEHNVRSIHGINYTRLWNTELLDVVDEFASDFGPPKKASSGHGKGLYAGERDLFAFLVDDNAWVEVGGDQFAPGFFVWNSEVGCRSLGIQTFWYQHICGNHIVWDCIDVKEFTRKHTASVRDGLGQIRLMLESLIDVKNQRQEQFAAKIEQARKTKLGDDAEEVTKLLRKQGIPLGMLKAATKITAGNNSAFAWVDALTRATGKLQFAGARNALDQKIGSILSLVA